MAVLANILHKFEESERTAGEAIGLASATPLNRLIDGMLYGILRIRFYAERRSAE